MFFNYFIFNLIKKVYTAVCGTMYFIFKLGTNRPTKELTMNAQDVRTHLAVSDHNGVYCPSVFLTRYENGLCCADTKDEICTNERIEEAVEFVKDRENIYKDGYWDEWDFVMNNVKVWTEICNGMDAEYWTINQNGDVWLLSDSDVEAMDEKQTELFWEQYAPFVN